MSKIKFDGKDFDEKSNLWDSVMTWACDGDPLAIDRAVQRLIKKYVKRERKRLARVMQHQQEIAIDGFLKNLAADWAVPVKALTGTRSPISKEEESGLDRFFTRNHKPMSWPSDFPGKH